MGTDIHLFVEKRDDAGVWKPVKLTEDQWAENGDVHFGGKYNFFDRNYDLFAMLADVRNGSGFAGFTTGQGFNPIGKPKGLPKDLSSELRSVLAYDDGDAYDNAMRDYGAGWLGEHSHSWLTVAELDAYDWTQTTRHAVYEREKDGMIPLNNPGKQSWSDPVPYSECAGRFYSLFLPALRKLGSSEHVRIVFGFDS